MYTTKNFKTKKELKEAVEKWNNFIANPPANASLAISIPVAVRLYAPGLGEPKQNGRETVEGPHYPEPHRWYAQVEVADGIVVKVK